MERINNLKKDLIEAYLDYYIDLHEQDIAELENVYNKYNQEMKKLYGEKFWDIVEIQNSIRNTFFIKDKFIVDNIYLINKSFKDWKIVKMNNEILLIHEVELT